MQAEAIVRQRVQELMGRSSLDARERNDLRTLAAAFPDEQVTVDDMLLMYLEGDRDWRADYELLFRRPPGRTATRRRR